MSESTEGGGGRRHELLEQARTLSPRDQRELAALLYGGRPSTPPPERFATALEAVPDEEVPAVVAALKEGIEVAKQGKDPLGPLGVVSPDLRAAAEKNNSRRSKPAIHSVQVAARWFAENHPTDDEGEGEEETPAEDGAPAAPKHRKRRRR